MRTIGVRELRLHPIVSETANLSAVTISEIKARLRMARVLTHYDLRPDRNRHLRCPFHDDRTASMQVYPDTDTVFCRAAGCPAHGHAVDVIDFVMRVEGCSKHEAILKTAQLAGAAPAAERRSGAAEAKGTNRAVADEAARRAVLRRVWATMTAGAQQSTVARTYLGSRALDAEALAEAGAAVGYNSGQMHHGARRDEALVASCLRWGLLSDTGRKSRTGAPALRTFARDCIAFALRGEAGDVDGLYFRSVRRDMKGRHFYLRDRRGLWPRWPRADARRVLLCESVVDTASVVQHQAAVLREADGWCALALYGTSGWTGEHAAALDRLGALEEVCLMLDADAAGRAATRKLAGVIVERWPSARVTTAGLPDGDDANGALVAAGPEALARAVAERSEVDAEPTDPPARRTETSAAPVPDVKLTEPTLPPAAEASPGHLDPSNPNDLRLRGTVAEYRVKGFRAGQRDSLRVTVQIAAGGSVTLKVDLYELREVKRAARAAADELGVDERAVAQDLDRLARELEGYQEREGARGPERRQVAMTPTQRAEGLAFWRAPELMRRLGERIGRAGIVGEEANRLLLFVVATTYKMPDTLHALIQGSSGSGKTRLLDVVARCMPAEDVRRYTRVTDNAFYNHAPGYLRGTLLCLEDLDGIREDAQLAVRELMSAGVLRSAVSVKDDRTGAITAGERTVEGPVATLACTTRGEVYEDNVSRSLVVAVDESPAQTARVIAYQDARAAGRVSRAEEEEHQAFLANCVRLLEPLAVVNPYAGRVSLPAGAHKLRRLHELYLSFVRQITLLHQHQRKRDARGRLVAEVADLRCAAAVLFESIVLKVDELDGSTRQFYERLKAWVGDNGKAEFTQREVRSALHVSRSRCSRLFARLGGAEYLTSEYAGNRRRVCYRLSEPDDYQRLRTQIREGLVRQIDALEAGEREGSEDGQGDEV